MKRPLERTGNAKESGRPESARDEKRVRALVVGSFLKKMRRKAGLTQSQLADQLSYTSAQFISNWERGLCLPPLDVLPKLCQLCGIPSEHLIEVVHRYQVALLELQKKKLINLFREAASPERRARPLA